MSDDMYRFLRLDVVISHGVTNPCIINTRDVAMVYANGPDHSLVRFTPESGLGEINVELPFEVLSARIR